MLGHQNAAVNSYAERFILTITKKATLANAKFTDQERTFIYCTAVKHSADIYNLMRPHRGLGFRTPYEAWTGHRPNANWLRIFGCTAYVYLEPAERPNGKRSRPYVAGIYVGMDPEAVGTKPTHNIYIPSIAQMLIGCVYLDALPTFILRPQIAPVLFSCIQRHVLFLRRRRNASMETGIIVSNITL